MHNPVAHEIEALRRLAAKSIHAAEAFGCLYPHAWAALNGPHFHFSIWRLDGGLKLSLDAYGALGLWDRKGIEEDQRHADGTGIDDDRWHAMQLNFGAEDSRQGYEYLAKLARTLVAGHAVTMGGGSRIKLSWMLAKPRKDAPWFVDDGEDHA